MPVLLLTNTIHHCATKIYPHREFTISENPENIRREINREYFSRITEH